MPKTSVQTNIPLVVVAGGAGFLGSHLCESLLQSGVKVIAIDDLITGSMANLEAIKQHPNFEFIECNINQGLPPLLSERPITHVVHSAGVETHGENQQATLGVALTGSYGTKNLLDLSVSAGATFVLISTTAIYDGLLSSTNLANYYGSDLSQQARFSYNETKRYAEGLCQLYAQEYNLDVRVARLAELYGPRMDLRRPELLPRLIKGVLAGEDLNVNADSSLPLSLIYVDDAVYGISRLLFADQKAKGSIYNFVNPEKVSVISVSYILRELLPQGKEVLFNPVDKVEEYSSPKLSLDKVKRDLDWEPTIEVSDGLRKTVAFFQKSTPILGDHIIKSEQLQTVAPTAKALSPEKAKHSPIEPGKIEGLSGVGGLRYRGAGIDGYGVKELANVTKVAMPEKAISEPLLLEPKKEHPKRKRVAKPWFKRLLLGLVAITLYVGVGWPSQHILASTAQVVWKTSGAGWAASTLDLDGAADQLKASALAGDEIVQGMGRLEWLMKLTGQTESWQQLSAGVRSGVLTMEGIADMAKAADPLAKQAIGLARLDKPASGGRFTLDISKSAQSTSQATQQLREASGVLDRPQSAVVAGANWPAKGWLGQLLSKEAEAIRQLEVISKQTEQLLAVLPTALGSDGTKTYLIMMQNSNELRPTGGFMGSYVLVHVKNGRIADYKVDDIYNPNGQLKDLVTAPAPFIKAFDSKSMDLANANWWPDATVSGEQIASLYSQATGERIDGVGFITTTMINGILRSVGPMHLGGYDETVTADNFDQLAQIYADVGFTPGSTAKKDFLGAMTAQLIDVLHNGNMLTWLKVANQTTRGLKGREVQIWSADKEVLSWLDDRGWSGRLAETSGDYLRVVDANMSANKSNYYVQRSTTYDVNVDRNGNLHSIATINWTHSGDSATWPGGDYLVYVRVYAPLGSRLTSWSGFDQDGVVAEVEGGKVSFGGMLKVPYGTTRQVEVRYDLPDSLALSSTKGSYTLMWQKQSGIPAEALNVHFNTPLFLEASQVSSGGSLNGQKVVWQTKGQEDVSLRSLFLPR